MTTPRAERAPLLLTNVAVRLQWKLLHLGTPRLQRLALGMLSRSLPQLNPKSLVLPVNEFAELRVTACANVEDHLLHWLGQLQSVDVTPRVLHPYENGMTTLALATQLASLLRVLLPLPKWSQLRRKVEGALDKVKYIFHDSDGDEEDDETSPAKFKEAWRLDRSNSRERESIVRALASFAILGGDSPALYPGCRVSVDGESGVMLRFNRVADGAIVVLDSAPTSIVRCKLNADVLPLRVMQPDPAALTLTAALAPVG